MLFDLVVASAILKSKLQPIGDGLWDSLTELLQSFLGSLLSQQQQSSIMDYLPTLGGIATQ